jgi:subtilisin family serine protease
VIYTRSPGALRRAGISHGSGTAAFKVARLTRDQIAQAAALGEVQALRAASAAEADNDVVAGLTGARLLNNGRLAGTNYTGAGVLACIIDSGLDWSHRDFRGLGTDQTQSRVLYLWDQTLTAESGEQAPSGRRSFPSGTFNYGVEYSRADIEDEIDGLPAGAVRSQDTDGHGTHVAGTLAGNGGAHSSGKYKGMAPDADLIVVKAGNESFPTSNIIDGMNYCGDIAAAQGKPLIVNMSLGSDYGPHDGTMPGDEAVESFTGGVAGRAVIAAAGNSAADQIHTQGSMAASGGTASFTINVPSAPSEGEFQADVWIDDASDVTVTVSSPNGTMTSTSPGNTVINAAQDGEVFLANTTSPFLGGGDREISLSVTDDAGQAPAPGDWTVTLTNASSSAVGFHAWLYDNEVTGGVTATIVGGGGAYTIGSPGSSPGAITVAASVHRWRWMSAEQGPRFFCGTGTCDGYPNRSDGIGRFSSRGPLREQPGGVQKPNLSAPGKGTASALSSVAGIPSSDSRVLPGGAHWIQFGTSMSAPAVAGTAALLLQEDPSLSSDAIKSAFEESADEDGFTGPTPNPTWGHGRLNAVQAMTRVIDPGGIATNDIYAYDGWTNVGSREVTGNEKIAVRFTPAREGVVSGFLLHPSSTVNLSGNLIVEVWSDDGTGYPGSKLGSAQALDKDRLLPYSWNYLDITDADVTVDAGTNYHLVLSFENSGDNMFVRVDQGSPDNRSYYYSLGFWNLITAYDYRMRPVVTRSTASGQLPVEFTGLDAQRDGSGILLTWATESESANAGFEVQRRAGSGEPWTELGFVQGAGTTTEPRRYSFADASLPFGADSLTYRLKQVDLGGSAQYSRAVSIALRAPERLTLHPAFPNPTPGPATIRYEVPRPTHVRLVVYDALGQRVVVLVRRKRAPGRYEASLPAGRLASGLYFVRLETDGAARTQKLTIVR